MSIEMGNELGNDPTHRKGLIFAKGALNHSLPQTFDRKRAYHKKRNTCDKKSTS